MIHLNEKMEYDGMLSGGKHFLKITQSLNHLLIERSQNIKINTRRNKERDDVTDTTENNIVRWFQNRWRHNKLPNPTTPPYMPVMDNHGSCSFEREHSAPDEPRRA